MRVLSFRQSQNNNKTQKSSIGLYSQEKKKAALISMIRKLKPLSSFLVLCCLWGFPVSILPGIYIPTDTTWVGVVGVVVGVGRAPLCRPFFPLLVLCLFLALSGNCLGLLVGFGLGLVSWSWFWSCLLPSLYCLGFVFVFSSLCCVACLVFALP